MFDSLRMGILWIKDTVNGTQVVKKSHNKMLPVWFWTHVYNATHAKNFLGGRFRDTRVNHENNKNKRPIEVTRYTVHIYIYKNFIA